MNMRFVTLHIKRDTSLNFNSKKRQLERWLGKDISDDDFMKIILFPQIKFEIRKTKKKAEMSMAPKTVLI